MKDKVIFLNGDLAFELEKIKSFDAPITVTRAEDFNLEYPFAIDIEDSSYFYNNEIDRDKDYDKLKKELKKMNFYFVD